MPLQLLHHSERQKLGCEMQTDIQLQSTVAHSVQTRPDVPVGPALVSRLLMLGGQQARFREIYTPWISVLMEMKWTSQKWSKTSQGCKRC